MYHNSMYTNTDDNCGIYGQCNGQCQNRCMQCRGPTGAVGRQGTTGPTGPQGPPTILTRPLIGTPVRYAEYTLNLATGDTRAIPQNQVIGFPTERHNDDIVTTDPLNSVFNLKFNTFNYRVDFYVPLDNNTEATILLKFFSNGQDVILARVTHRLIAGRVSSQLLSGFTTIAHEDISLVFNAVTVVADNDMIIGSSEFASQAKILFTALPID